MSNETSAFEFNPHAITYLTPEATAAERELGPQARSFWPDCFGLAAEVITLTTHTGTHLDAPGYYGPTEPKRRTIDEVPLEWCFCDGVVLDFPDKNGSRASPATSMKPDRITTP